MKSGPRRTIVWLRASAAYKAADKRCVDLERTGEGRASEAKKEFDKLENSLRRPRPCQNRRMILSSGRGALQ
jgi:hypothetical protein